MALETTRFFGLMTRVHIGGILGRLRVLRGRSMMLPFVLVLFVIGYLMTGYVLFEKGLTFLSNFSVIGALLTQRIMYLIFMFFFMMLVFSNLIIGYTALFKNRETDWLLSLPVRHADIYRWKFLESLVVSSWALMFLSAPMMAAFGVVHQAEGWFYLNTFLLYIPYVVLPAVLGSWGILLLVRVVGRPWFKRALVWVGLGLVLVVAIGVRPTSDIEAASLREVVSFEKLLQHTRISTHPALPSSWMASSVLAWSEGLGQQGVFHALLLLSYALLAVWLTFEVMARLFYSSWTHAFGGRSRRFQERAEAKRLAAMRVGWFEKLLRAWPGISPSWRALLLKDSRLFWRDPSQWTQFLIFFGLLFIYVLNLRNISYTFESPFWTRMISFLNLCACAMTLSTLTTRFVFPQFSLEGRRIWILGLVPKGLPQVLIQKFLLSFFATGGITVLLMTASSMMLRLPWAQVALFSAAIALMSATLAATATGMGALFPDFREDNPSKIVSGFGGTFCLVISFLYIVLFIGLAAFPATLEFADPPIGALAVAQARWACGIAGVVLSVGLMTATMWPALHKVKNLEI